MEYKFVELVNIDKVQELTDLFYNATGILTAILDLEGNILTASGWRRLCTDYHRKNTKSQFRCTESDTHINKEISEGKKYAIYKCKNGLIDAAAPVKVQGKHVATVYTGQLFFEKPDLDFFLQQAKELEFDVSDYIKAVLDIPVMTEKKLKSVMDYLCSFAEMLGEMGYKEFKHLKSDEELRLSNEELKNTQNVLIASMEELTRQYSNIQEKERIEKEYEELLKYAIEGTGLIVWDWRITTNQIFFTKTFKELLGFEANEFTGNREEYFKNIHPDDLDILKDKHNRYLNGDSENYFNEYRIKSRNGQYIWVASKGKIIERDSQGKPLRMTGTLTDITAYKK